MKLGRVIRTMEKNYPKNYVIEDTDKSKETAWQIGQKRLNQIPVTYLLCDHFVFSFFFFFPEMETILLLSAQGCYENYIICNR